MIKRLAIIITFLSLSHMGWSVVRCIQLSDGTWQCSGSGNSTDASITTNLVGICTNCIQMSSNECQNLKSEVIDSLYNSRSMLYESIDIIDSQIDSLSYITDEGDTFTQVRTYWTKEDALSASQSVYSLNNVGVAGKAADTLGTSDNSIANYYFTSVQPRVSSAKSSLETAASAIRQNIQYQNQILQFVDYNINCSACSYNVGLTVSNNPFTVCTECPCSEQLQALLSVALNIQVNSQEILSSLEKFRIQNHADLQGISNLTYRIDQYVEIDLDMMVHSISNNCMYLATTLLYANKLLNTDGSHIDLEQTSSDVFSDHGFDVTSYEKLNWYNRVELLLARLNGLGVDTNSTPQTLSENHIRQIDTSLRSFTNELTHLATPLPKTVFQSINNSVQLLKSQLPHSTPSAASSGIVLLDSGDWISEEPLILKVDVRVQNYCRVVFILIWSVASLVLFFHIVIKGTCLIWYLIEWINKIFVQFK